MVKDDDYCPKCGYARVIVKEGAIWKVRASFEEMEETKKLFEIPEMAWPEEEELRYASQEVYDCERICPRV